MDGLGKRLMVPGRHTQASISNQVRTLTHIGYDAGHTAGHGLADGIRKTFRPGSGTVDVQGSSQARDVSPFAQEKKSVSKRWFGHHLEKEWFFLSHARPDQHEAGLRMFPGDNGGCPQEPSMVFDG